MAGPVVAVIGEGLVELAFDKAADSAAVAPGGDAANIAVMAARLGAPTRLGGRLGQDPFGDWLLSFWETSGVDVSYVRRDSLAATGLYLNVPLADAQHRFVYWRRDSAGSRLAREDLTPGFFKDVGLMVITGVTLAVSPSSEAAAHHAIEVARSGSARVACVLNYRPALGADSERLLAVAAAADIVIGSDEDARAAFGTSDVEELARGLKVGELVLTGGGNPVRAIVEGAQIEQSVPSLPVVNAAGAGDAFAGAYLAARSSGSRAADALAWGVAAAAHSVGRVGCAQSYATRAELEQDALELVGAA